MKFDMTFRNLEHTPALDQTIRNKSEKLRKHLSDEASFDWVCWTEKNDHIAEVKLNDGRDHFMATAHSDSLYKSIDGAIKKLENQIQHKH